MKQFLLSMLLLLVVIAPTGQLTKTVANGGWTTNSSYLRYCGMPSADVISVASSPFRESVNVYYPAKAGTVFRVDGTSYRIVKAQHNELKVEVIGQ